MIQDMPVHGCDFCGFGHQSGFKIVAVKRRWRFFLHARLARIESGKSVNAGPFTGNEKDVIQGRETMLFCSSALSTSFHEFPLPAFRFTSHEGLTDESRTYPSWARTSAIHGAIYPAGARNQYRKVMPACFFQN